MIGDRHDPACPRPLDVLVVEDNEATRQLLADLLEDEGFTVRTAANGYLGLKLLRARRPDVILLDIQMPILDGLTLYDLIQADPGLAGVPVIFMSATPDWAGLARRGIRLCIRKPFEIETLISILKAAGEHRFITLDESSASAIPTGPDPSS